MFAATITVSDVLASNLFRLMGVPLAISLLGCFVRYTKCLIARLDPGPEVYIIWPDLFIAAIFNLLLLASDVAEKEAKSADKLLSVTAAGIFAALMLAVVTVISSKPRTSKFRIVTFSYIFPHMAALASLELGLLLATS
ncbi:MAG: hypothetical protein HOY79_51240 [Streptomyces sp.]|nr:hypothetical protein [Streptomyces sp.]